jgi:hypothetical protein
MNREELRKYLDDHKESVERGRLMTPAELAHRMVEANKKKKEQRETR